MQNRNGAGGFVLNDLIGMHRGGAPCRVDVDGVIDIDNARLGQMLVAFVGFLIIDGDLVRVVFAHRGVEDFCVIENPSAGAKEDGEGGGGSYSQAASEALRGLKPGESPRRFHGHAAKAQRLQ